jgi:hypothetical protein
MKYWFYVFTAAISLLLYACNSLRRIRMENKSGEDADITWVINQDSINQSKLFYSNSDTVRFHLQQKRPYNRVKMSFGVGKWTPKELSKFVDDISTLEIKWKGGTIKLDSTQIFEYLVVRRKGIDNSQIKIELK